MIILNVGLKIDALGDEFNTDSVCKARAYVAQCYFVKAGYPVSMQITQSDTELTAIIGIYPKHLGDTRINASGYVRELADALGQDCIAMYDTESGQGTLVGINADKWGEFNKDYFLMP